MREVHYEVLHPTQRSPCRGCGRELEDKNQCAADCGRLRLFRVEAGLDMEEETMPVRAENETKTKAAAPKRKHAPAARKEPDPGGPPTLGQLVRTILDGFPGGREFTLEDLGREASALVGRKVNSGTVSTYLSEAIRKGFPATRRRNGPGQPCTYTINRPVAPAQPPDRTEGAREPTSDTAPDSAREPAAVSTIAAAITIHVAIDRIRLIDFLESLGLHIVPGGIELGAIYLRSA